MNTTFFRGVFGLCCSLALFLSGIPLASAQEAKACVQVNSKTSSGRAHNELKNICGFPIGLIYCHPRSGMPGTKATECENNGRYYQQFTSLQPDQTTGNYYSAPGDVRVEYGACRGKESSIKQGANGAYQCR